MTVVFLIHPEKMKYCFVYETNTVSVIHSIMCSCLTACGYIAAVTMQQIRCSIQVIIKEKTMRQAKKDIKRFSIYMLLAWILNQVISVFLIFIGVDDFSEELWLNVGALMVILVIFAYQLSRLIKTVNKLERNSEDLSAFISEKRIVIG